MTIKKGDVTVFEAPNWLIIMGLWSITDMVLGVTKNICKRTKTVETTETIEISGPEQTTE